MSQPPHIISLKLEREKRSPGEPQVSVRVVRSKRLVLFQVSSWDTGLGMTWHLSVNEARRLGEMFLEAAGEPEPKQGA